MGIAVVCDQIDGLLQKVEKAHAAVLKEQVAAKELFDRMNAVIDEVQDSWSDSWAGYHASLYFGDFARPGLSSQFNVEWGSLRGIPQGWRDRSDADVTSYIERKSAVSISQLEALSAAAYASAFSLYQDVQALVTPILEASGDSSKALLDELYNEKWGISQVVYLNQARPSQITTRDSVAALQGIKTPPHVALRARAISEYSRVAASVTALERAKLALKQARTALSITSRPLNGADGGGFIKWLVLALIIVVAIETFILLRPPVLTWFNTNFTQDFLITPTRLGFAWSDVIANALAALVLLPFGWLMRRAVGWLSTN